MYEPAAVVVGEEEPGATEKAIYGIIVPDALVLNTPFTWKGFATAFWTKCIK